MALNNDLQKAEKCSDLICRSRGPAEPLRRLLPEPCEARSGLLTTPPPLR